jgi:hypothetical protein
MPRIGSSSRVYITSQSEAPVSCRESGGLRVSRAARDAISNLPLAKEVTDLSIKVTATRVKIDDNAEVPEAEIVREGDDLDGYSSSSSPIRSYVRRYEGSSNRGEELPCIHQDVIPRADDPIPVLSQWRDSEDLWNLFVVDQPVDLGYTTAQVYDPSNEGVHEDSEEDLYILDRGTPLTELESVASTASHLDLEMSWDRDLRLYRDSQSSYRDRLEGAVRRVPGVLAEGLHRVREQSVPILNRVENVARNILSRSNRQIFPSD